MFKLVVLSVLLAAAVASGIHGVAPLAYSHYAVPAVAVPSAVSYQTRTDVVSKPVVATYAEAAPVVAAYAAPVAYHAAYAAPVVAAPVIKSVAQGATITSYTSPGVVESVAHGSPVVAAYSAPQYW